MKFVLAMNAIGNDIGEFLPVARKAEELGFDGVLVGDHIAMPAQVEASAPYTRDGKSPMGMETAWPDCFAIMTAMAAVTQKLRVISSIYLVALRHPVIIAKALNTMAVLSDNRTVLGVGAGWMKDEFDILGSDFTTRGARTDEAIQILRRLGRDGEVEWESRHYSIPRLSVLPKPSRPAPIYVGGESAFALRRAALLGDGYLSTLRTMRTLKGHAQNIAEQREQAGLLGQPFEFVGTPADARGPEDYAQMEAAGIATAAVLPWMAPYDKGSPPLDVKLAAMEAFAESTLRHFA